MTMRIQASVRRPSFVLRLAAAGLAAVALWPGAARAQAVSGPSPVPGTVTITLAEYNRLVDRAGAPAAASTTAPVGAFVSHADLALRAGADLLRGTITLQGEVLRDGPTAVALFSGGTLLAARAGAQPVPVIVVDGRFTAVLPGAGPFTLQLDWAGPIVTEPGRASAQLPVVAAGAVRATLDAPGEGSDLTVERALVTRRTPAQGRLVVEATLSPGAAPSRVSWSSREAPSAAPVRALRLLDDVKTLLTIGESELRLTALVDVSVLQGSTSSLALRVPAGFALTSFTGAPTDVKIDGEERLVLTVPAGRARHQFLVVLEKALTDAASRRSITLPSIEGSQRETGDVALEGVGALELEVQEARPLTRIDVAELTAPHRGLARDAILAAYRYQRRAADPVTLTLDVTRFPDAAVLAAAADRATATTLVTVKGRSLTEITLTVRNQAQPFLKVGLPADATLLSAEVAGVAVKPAQGADGLRVPLLRAGFRPQGPYQVSFVYLHEGAPFAPKGDASLALARVDLPIAWLEWELFLPDRLEASRFEGAGIPQALVGATFMSTTPLPYSLAEDALVKDAQDKPVRAEQRAAANEPAPQQLSLNVQNLQRRASGVLPVRLDVPRTGQSHTFVRPLVLDEETRLGFRYKLKR